MIKLNLAANQGIKTDGKILPIEEILPPPQSDVQARVQPGAKKSDQSIEDLIQARQKSAAKKKIDASVFDALEQNLDMIETAEEEEFTPQDKKKSRADELEKPVKVRKRRRTRRFIAFLFFVALCAAGYTWYTGEWTVRDVQNFYQKNIAQKITGQLDRILPKHSKQVKNTAQKVGKQLPGVMKGAAEMGKGVASSTVNALEPIAYPNEISDYYIDLINRGNVLLSATAGIFQKLPPNASLQYLEGNADRITFVVYIATREAGLALKRDLSETGLFLKPDIFYIERAGANPANPFQVMAVLKTSGKITLRTKGFRHKSDTALGQILGRIGKQHQVTYSGFNIYQGQANQPYKSKLTGSVSFKHIAPFLETLINTKINFGADKIYISDNSGRNLVNSILSLSLESEIFPRKS